ETEQIGAVLGEVLEIGLIQFISVFARYASLKEISQFIAILFSLALQGFQVLGEQPVCITAHQVAYYGYTALAPSKARPLVAAHEAPHRKLVAAGRVDARIEYGIEAVHVQAP